MKLVSFTSADGGTRVGLVNASNGLIDIGRRLGVKTLRELLTRSLQAEALSFSGEPTDYEIGEVELLPVITDPEHFICVGSNYADHIQEVQRAGIQRTAPKYPSLFIRFADSLAGANGPMVRPRVSSDFDYEAELAVIIGREGRYLSQDQALEHVAGYTCFNDGSARDWQFHTSQITSGKNFPRTGALGPWLVTSDEVGDPNSLDISFRLNGETLQQSNTSQMIFNVASIISYVSNLLLLKPGDVIATGTPAGVGFARTPPVFLQPGSVCEVEIEKIGLLRNKVQAESM